MIDAAELTSEQYDEVKRGWIEDMNNPGIKAVCLFASSLGSSPLISPCLDRSHHSQLGMEEAKGEHGRSTIGNTPDSP